MNERIGVARRSIRQGLVPDDALSFFRYTKMSGLGCASARHGTVELPRRDLLEIPEIKYSADLPILESTTSCPLYLLARAQFQRRLNEHAPQEP